MVGNMVKIPEEDDSPEKRADRIFDILDTDCDGKRE